MSKQAFLVFGPESSATRFVSGCLLKAGCAGDNDHTQVFDKAPPTQEKIVWRRSFPHKWDDPDNFPFNIKGSIGWPDTDKMYEHLTQLGYSSTVVVTCRDWYSISLSSARIGYRPHTKTMELGYKNTKESYKRIFNFVNKYDLDYVMFNYEAALLHGTKYINNILETLGLDTVQDFDIKDQNSKYYR